MRICVDLDGVICETKQANQNYSEVKPMPGSIKKMQSLKKAGHYIIVSTARHMKTTKGDVGQVVARIGEETLAWLRKHKVPYDEIHFGKPYAHVYLDDKAIRFNGWKKIEENGNNLKLKSEDRDSF